MSRSGVAGRPWASLPTSLPPPAPWPRASRRVGEVRRRRHSRAAERGANGGLVEAALAQKGGAWPVLGEHGEQQSGVDARIAEVADGQLAVAEPHRDRAALAQSALEVEALGWVDQMAQRLVAQAGGVEAAQPSRLGIGGQRQQQV